MKRIISLLIAFVLCFAVLAAAGAETAMVLTPIDAQDMRLGQCMVPQGYTMYPVPDFSGSSRSLTDPLGLGVIVTSPDGRVYGKMCHAERRDKGVAVNIFGEQDMQLFESGVEYFKC